MKPVFDETFWRVFQPLTRNRNYAVLDIFHYNSLEDTTYLTLEAEHKKGDVQSTFIPARLISNLAQFGEQVASQLDHLVREQVELLVQHDDGTWWIDGTCL